MNTLTDSESVTDSVETQVVPVLGKVKRPDFGSGRYSAEMGRLYDDTQKLFRFTTAQAEKFARQAASDAGEVLAKCIVEIKVGKANSDGKATISEASKVKGISLTNALHLVRAIQWIGDAEKNSVSYGRTTWRISEMNDNLAKYINTL